MKMWCIYSVEYYSATKTMKFPGKWVNLECIILSKVTQMQKGKRKFIFFLKNRTYHVIYTWLYIRNCSISKVRHLGRWQRVVLMRKTYEMSYDKRHKASFNSHIFFEMAKSMKLWKCKTISKAQTLQKGYFNCIAVHWEPHTHCLSRQKEKYIIGSSKSYWVTY